MAYTRLIVLVLLFEVIVTAATGLGVYYGFALFPYSQSTAAGGQETVGLNVSIPLYMPSMTDLKIPYSYLDSGTQAWGFAAFGLSAALIVLQGFVRGMYLGGLKEWVLYRKQTLLLDYGRKYFRAMTAWSLFQYTVGAGIILLAVVFFPIGLLLMIVLLFYSFTPYLIVLQNLAFTEAAAKAPRLFRRYFRAFLPLALLALLCTLAISLLRSLAAPWNYAVPLLVYAWLGTLLIGEFLHRLAVRLKADGELLLKCPTGELKPHRMRNGMLVLLVPVLVWAGIFTASGKHLNILETGGKQQLGGISYQTSFSDVFYVSEQRYTAYDWHTGDFSITMKLPDLSGAEKPEELRGTADITWLVSSEARTVNGNTTYTEVKPVLRKSRLLYRLVRETAEDGSFYYSSRSGAASMMPGGEQLYEPLSVQILVSGDGRHIFVLQHPARFDAAAVYRVSDDGMALIPGTSPVNPSDFQTYWFTADHSSENLFRLLASKNQRNTTASMNQAYIALACAMQEGDGQMVVRLLEMMRQAGVQVNAPEWDAETWTESLQERYKEVSLQETLELLSKAGVQGGYDVKELPEQSDDKVAAHQLVVPFPGRNLLITFIESKEDGKLLSITVMD